MNISTIILNLLSNHTEKPMNFSKFMNEDRIKTQPKVHSVIPQEYLDNTKQWDNELYPNQTILKKS